MKLALVVCLFFCIFQINGEDRLIQFNETYSVWMPIEAVEKLASESGKDAHFIDITDYPDLGKNRIRAPAIPSQPTHQDVVEPLLALLSSARISSVITQLSSYATRYYTSSTGVAAVNWLASQYRSFIGSRSDIEVITFTHTWAQPSVIARIYGKGPSADELVIIGGHVDSTSGSGAAPGADDDASGSSTVLEIFRVLATQGFEPERTLEFHGYAAEEVGLRGSQAIVQSYSNEGKVVAGMLQLDMTGYVRSGTTRTIGTVTDFTNAQLTAFLRALVNAYSNVGFTNTQCGYGCSDHASWFRGGYPASFAFESIFSNSNPYIHTSNDVISNLNINHALDFARLGLGFAVELSYSEGK